MSVVTRKVALPVQYREEAALICDACGKQVLTDRMLAIGWFRGVLRLADPGGSVVDKFVCDYCDECWPKMQRAMHQEEKAIQAEKVAVAAEKHGVA